MATVKDTMVQDVDPLNAGIYFDGYMYVGGRKHLERPDYFAPYFTARASPGFQRSARQVFPA